MIVSPLDEWKYLYPFSVADGAPRNSRIDLQAWLAGDERQQAMYPAVGLSKLYECEIGPGDVVYIPPGGPSHRCRLAEHTLARVHSAELELVHFGQAGGTMSRRSRAIVQSSSRLT